MITIGHVILYVMIGFPLAVVGVLIDDWLFGEVRSKRQAERWAMEVLTGVSEEGREEYEAILDECVKEYGEEEKVSLAN